jgi:hypothetical protein
MVACIIFYLIQFNYPNNITVKTFSVPLSQIFFSIFPHQNPFFSKFELQKLRCGFSMGAGYLQYLEYYIEGLID